MTATPTFDPVPILANELQLARTGVSAVCSLLDEGGTVPFIARYRKEATGGLDEVQIRTIQERRDYLLELEQRREAVLSTIAEQGKLTDELRASILACKTKAELEDLYLPYKPKRRTRATIARERGLEPLAQLILQQPDDGTPEAAAGPFVAPDREVADVEAALEGARHIVGEGISERVEVRRLVRERFSSEGRLAASVNPKKKGERTKFEQYYDFSESVREIPSHRYLALRRGEREKVLRVQLEADTEAIIGRIEELSGLRRGSPFAAQLQLAAREAYQRLVAPSVEKDIRAGLKERSDEAAVEVFASNLRNLLLAAPLGTRSVVGIDPGIRTGCKCAALDETGKFKESITIFISQGEEKAERSRQQLTAFFERHTPFAVAVGNGTGGRETEAFVRELIKRGGDSEPRPIVVQVNESGASIYSASDVAREEFPDLDLTIRGAISIARRLQDPLAELVKIEPKAIGVGQYQHDVHQPLLQRQLDSVVESCVNQVGVELNTASAPLLAQVAGIGPGLAKNVVAHRERRGAFASRRQLLDVPKLGPKTFEQAAGFIRVRGGEHPLDASAVHPERYDLVARMAKDLGVELARLMGDTELVGKIELSRYIDGDVGEPTLKDIIAELRKPGRDPRSAFEPPRFREDVATMEDLEDGMTLEGVVTNVTAFGAFVDVGVHQDGLVHISQLSDQFVKDPHTVVQVGGKLKVRVLSVDLDRKRISLSARSGEAKRPGRGEERRPPADRGKAGGSGKGKGKSPGKGQGGREQPNTFSNSPFAALLKGKR
jgi:uncharacterized protein